MKLKINTSSAKAWGEVEEEPVSPEAQYLNSSALCVSNLVVFESEIPIDDSQAMLTLENLFLPINPRFSSIMVKDEHGNSRWRKVQVKLEDHINVPVFPSGLEFYDDYMQEYIAKIATERLPEDQPLWNTHIIKYPTKNAAGSLVFKLHHSLGDGFSLMTALFNCVQRADNPSLPLTFPSIGSTQAQNWGVYRALSDVFSMCINTIKDFSWSLALSSIKDSVTPIRSGDVGIEDRPITLSTVTFSLSDIKQIKGKLKGTVNDVITGIIFYGMQLYLQAAGQETKPAKVTALVLLNTRAIRTYQPLKEMARRDSKVPWGNHFAFLHVSIPTNKDPENADPLHSIRRAKKIIKAKRNSLGVYLTAGILEIMRKFRGSEAVSRHIYKTLTNTSLTISNLIGPLEKLQIANHPCKSFYFMVVRAPQSLTITVVSYMGTIKVAIGAERDFINSELLVSCMEKSFERIFDAAVGNRT
ncbi:uncharacterized protein A4U43_C04F13250 [Asparagus officinalis]|uniref:Uncharacterized protein n=1 Tax=Asparagus officinalis TaxID=4686 RepID=A0A5P1F111_ASPOF|nr:O-acyltransferase WSD1-like isoform X1 [Asparagus officinalis]ONK71872.1 uncharacterized protein A4U43_C04F13250 [Asparagus officinalis]